MLTRIISGAVAVVILSVVLFFHDTIVLPIAVALMIAIMLFELLRAVKLHKCIPVLCAVELYAILVPFMPLECIQLKYLKSGWIVYTESEVINIVYRNLNTNFLLFIISAFVCVSN